MRPEGEQRCSARAAASRAHRPHRHGAGHAGSWMPAARGTLGVVVPGPAVPSAPGNAFLRGNAQRTPRWGPARGKERLSPQRRRAVSAGRAGPSAAPRGPGGAVLRWGRCGAGRPGGDPPAGSAGPRSRTPPPWAGPESGHGGGPGRHSRPAPGEAGRAGSGAERSGAGRRGTAGLRPRGGAGARGGAWLPTAPLRSAADVARARGGHGGRQQAEQAGGGQEEGEGGGPRRGRGAVRGAERGGPERSGEARPGPAALHGAPAVEAARGGRACAAALPALCVCRALCLLDLFYISLFPLSSSFSFLFPLLFPFFLLAGQFGPLRPSAMPACVKVKRTGKCPGAARASILKSSRGSFSFRRLSP